MSGTRKTVDVFVTVGSLGGVFDATGYPTYRAAEESVRRMGNEPYWYPDGVRIERRRFDLPASAFWTNDLVSVKLHRGGRDNADGIHLGGGWTDPVFGLVSVTTINMATGRVTGYLVEPGTERPIQCMEMRAGVQGFPYRNARLVRANDGADE